MSQRQKQRPRSYTINYVRFWCMLKLVNCVWRLSLPNQCSAWWFECQLHRELTEQREHYTVDLLSPLMMTNSQRHTADAQNPTSLHQIFDQLWADFPVYTKNHQRFRRLAWSFRPRR
jgi:hypothetical protein